MAFGTPPAPLPTGVRDFLDYKTTRQSVFDNALAGLQTKYPVENEKYRLEIDNPHYDKIDDFKLEDEKKAILKRTTLARKLVGTWQLRDKATNKVLDKKKTVLASVPYLTRRGTYVINGNEYTVSNQLRLRSGMFTRQKDNGDFEAHFNVLKGGPSFRVFMEPKTGIFRLNVKQSRLKLYPIMRAMGVTDKELMNWWGPEIFGANVVAKEEGVQRKAYDRLASTRAMKETNEDNGKYDFKSLLEGFEMDPVVMQKTLGKPYNRITPEVMMATTQKLLQISRGEAEPDDRDSLAFQHVHSIEDFIKERFEKDAGRIAARALWRATLRKDLSGMQPGALNPQIESLFYKSGLAQPLEEINPIDALDQNMRLVRMGEGGIQSGDQVPDEARNVQPSHFLFVDPIRSPESGKVGVDSRVAYQTYKGKDGQLYSLANNVRTKRPEYLSMLDIADKVVAFPGEIARAQKEGRKKVRVMSNNRMRYANIKDVDYEAPNHQGMFTFGSNLVPMVSAIKGGRLLMGAKMASQALPLQSAEAPLVQSAMPNDVDSFESLAGRSAGIIEAESTGEVVGVSSSAIKVKQRDGSISTHELYNNFPLNRKTFYHNIPQVQVGDTVRKGQVLASSNFTDNQGVLSVGTNLRVGYMPYKGKNFEDAIVISQSAARKLTSEHMYTEKMDLEDHRKMDRGAFLGMYPGKFNKAQLDKIDDSGVVKVGQIVEKDDPLILGLERRTSKGAGQLHHKARSGYADASEVWEHEFPGEVTDVYSDKDGVKVAVKAYAPSQVGDKLSGRYGDKGVIGDIVPDAKMPTDAEGNPLEVLLNPLGVISRVNPSQMLEAVLGKIARKRGQPYTVPGFSNEDLTEFVISEMEKHGINDTEEVFDPEANRTVADVLVGERFFMKLHHTAESKESGRALGSYTIEGEPAAGEGDNPKRVGFGELTALISHGAIENIRDIKTIRGQRNDDYWRAVIQGYPPPTPDIPLTYKKFLSSLQGAGINIQKRGNYLHLMAMTDRDVGKMSAGAITSPETVKWASAFERGSLGEKSMDPVEGGLFDRGLTGGHGGTRWTHIDLNTPVPQPVMEEPIRRLLGLTGKDFEAVLSGEKELGEHGTGAEGMQKALAAMDPHKMMEEQMDTVKNTGSAAKRDLAVKRLKYLEALNRTGVHPKDMMVNKVPVIPPIFRPITSTTSFDAVADANRLYRTLMMANNNYKELSGQLTGDIVGQSRLNLYKAYKAVAGLGDPIRPDEKNQGVKGLLSHVFGSSPKNGLFQRRLLGSSVDLAGRATITPNPSLDMDQVGMPEDQAWKLYSPFIVRRLVRQLGDSGVSRSAAVKMVAEKTTAAREALVKEMEHRPVLATRAPALHRYSIMALQPVITSGKTLQLPPAIVPGFNADFDGDAMNFHVVISDDAIKEAKTKLLPSKNLRSPADFDILWAPRQEFLQGLYAATATKNEKPVRSFSDAKAAITAYRRGEIGLGDPVRIA